MQRLPAASAMLFLTTLVALAGCEPQARVWVVGGSIADSLTLGLSNRRDGGPQLQLNRLSVHTCDVVARRCAQCDYPIDDSAEWVLSREGDPGDRTDRILYGKPQKGMRTRREPRPITAPGCYVVQAVGEDSTREQRRAATGFRVTPEGAAIEMSPEEFKKVLRRRE